MAHEGDDGNNHDNTNENTGGDNDRNSNGSGTSELGNNDSKDVGLNGGEDSNIEPAIGKDINGNDGSNPEIENIDSIIDKDPGKETTEETQLNKEENKNDEIKLSNTPKDNSTQGISNGVHLTEEQIATIDFKITSNTKEELEQIKEMEKNGVFYELKGVEVKDVKDVTDKIPTENKGTFLGKPGDSEFVPNNKEAIETMAQFNRESVTYKDGHVDFEPFAKIEIENGVQINTTVKIGHMTSNRTNPTSEYGRRSDAHDPNLNPGNYAQADNALAAKLNGMNPNNNYTGKDIEIFRTENNYTWHEVEDLQTMQLIPTVIQEACPHTGGVAYSKEAQAYGAMEIEEPSSRNDEKSSSLDNNTSGSKDESMFADKGSDDKIDDETKGKENPSDSDEKNNMFADKGSGDKTVDEAKGKENPSDSNEKNNMFADKEPQKETTKVADNKEDEKNNGKGSAREEIDAICKDTGWSKETTEKIQSIEEAEIYKNANLKETEVNDKTCLVRTDIDFDQRDEFGRTNRERMENGNPPIAKNGETIELHHINQKSDNPLAELTTTEHRGKGNDSILHVKQKESEIDRNEFSKERKQHWESRSKGE